jgi:DNA-binding SARP family transcriptional activator
VLLLSSPKHSATREQALEALWPEENPELSTKRLDRIVYNFRQLCDPPGGESILTTEQNQLNLQRVWTDSDAFQHALQLAEQSIKQEEKVSFLKQALSLYQGDYLAGLPDSEGIRIQLQREQFLRLWVGTILEVVDLTADSQKDRFYLITLLSQLLEQDQTNEAAASRLIQLLAKGGRRVEAIHVYQRLKEALKKLDLSPLPQTRTLYEAVRRGLGAGQTFIGTSTITDEQIRGQHPPLTGRKEELRTLRKLLYTTPLRKKEGTKLILLTGDIGAGKTRLAEELSRGATQQGWLCTWARGYRQESNLPYRFWVDTLKQMVLYAEKEMKQEPNLGILLPELWRDTPPPTLDPALRQIQLQEAMSRFLQRLQTKIPLLIVFDDIQWIDRPSMEMLFYLLRHLKDGHAPAFLATGRTLELSSPDFKEIRSNLQSEGLEKEMHLGPLTEEEMHLLLKSLPLNQPINEQEVKQRAKGNPLFAISLASISNRPGLPKTINAAFDVLLQGLSPDTLKLLRAAAVIASYGKLNTSTLEKMMGELEIHDLLDDLLQLGLLEEHDSSLYFWHSLLTEHLYQSLSQSRKTYLHRQAAHALEGENEAPAIILLHLQLGGGDPKNIFHYARLAGERAMSVSAYKEAEAFLRTALTHLESTQGMQDTRLTILLQLAESRRIQGDFGEGRQLYTDILKLFLHEPGPATNTIPLQALLWREIAHTWYENGKIQLAWACCDEGIALLREAELGETQAPSIWGALVHERACSLWGQGKYHDAYQEAHRALHLLEQAVVQLRSNNNPMPAITFAQHIPRMQSELVDLGRACSLIGVLKEVLYGANDPTSLDDFRRAAAIFKQAGSLRELSSALGNIGNIHLLRAELAEAKARFQEGMEIAERLGDNPVLSVMSVNLALVAFRAGGIQEALRLFAQSLELVKDDALDSSIFSHAFASAYLEIGLLQSALPLITKAFLSARTADQNKPCHGLVLASVGYARLLQARQTPERQQKEILLLSARRLLSQALQHPIEPEYRREIELHLAHVALERGHLDLAAHQFNETLELSKNGGTTWSTIRAQRGIALVHLLREEYRDAENMLADLLEKCQEHSLRLEHIRALRLYGKTLCKQGKEEGIAYIREAEDKAQELLGDYTQGFPW